MEKNLQKSTTCGQRKRRSCVDALQAHGPPPSLESGRWAVGAGGPHPAHLSFRCDGRVVLFQRECQEREVHALHHVVLVADGGWEIHQIDGALQPAGRAVGSRRSSGWWVQATRAVGATPQRWQRTST